MGVRKPASIQDIIDKLTNVATVISREDLKSDQKQRISDAFELLAAGKPLPGSKSLHHKKIYVTFLQGIRQAVGLKGVVLCAVGLGPTNVMVMGDLFRLRLRREMKDIVDTAKGDLQGIADAYAKFFPVTNKGATATTPETDSHPAIRMEENRVPRNEGTAIEGTATTMSQYAGDAYHIIWDDVDRAVRDRCGQPFLIDTFKGDAHSFLIVPVTQSMVRFLTMQREKIYS